MTNTIDKRCNITNNSGQDVVVLNAANTATNAVKGSIKMVYEQDLTILGKTIANGATGTVVLDGTYVNSKDETKPSLIYELIMGVVMSIDFIKTKLCSKEKKLAEDTANENEGNPPTQEQQTAVETQSESVGTQAEADQQGVADRLGRTGNEPDVTVSSEDDLSTAQNQAQTAQNENLKQRSGDQVQSSISEGEYQMNELAQFGTTSYLEEAGTNLIDASNALPGARDSGDFTKVRSDIDEAKVNINDAGVALSVTDDVLEDIKESQAAQEEYAEASEKLDSESEEVSEGDVPEDIEPEVEL